MACRSMKRAQAAREELRRHLDLNIIHAKADALYDGHAELFKSNLSINIHLVDLGSWSSVLDFCSEIDKRYVGIVCCIIRRSLKRGQV